MSSKRIRPIRLIGQAAAANIGIPKCSHCNREAILTDGQVIYPHREDLWHKFFWKCPSRDCGAYVGCHPNTSKALGTPANEQLRKARSRAHASFDPLWKDNGNDRARRVEEYEWLMDQMGLDRDSCHIGMMTIEQCERVVLAVKVRMARPK